LSKMGGMRVNDLLRTKEARERRERARRVVERGKEVEGRKKVSLSAEGSGSRTGSRICAELDSS